MQSATVHTCPNGLKALILPRRETPVVAVHVWVETGSMLEGQYAGSGVSHLLEHMVFKGTQEYSAAQLNEAVSALGGLWNAYTSTDRTVFHIDGPSAHWREYLHILAQLVLHPTFPQEEWEREREVIRREMSMYRDDPNDATYRALIETLFLKHPRRLPVIGEPAAFDALSPEDMRRYYEERYVAGNMFICVVGDVEPDEVAQAVEAEVACLPAACAPPVNVPEEPRQWGPRVCRREFPRPTSSLMLAWRLPQLNHPDMPALSLLACILGDGRTAWLYKHFHDEQAMAHDVSTLILPQGHGEGAFVVEADVDRPARDNLRDALLAWMDELPERDFQAALQRALRQLRVRHMKTHAAVQSTAEALGGFWHHFRNVGAYEEWRAALEAVTPQDLQRVARTWLRPQRLTEVSVDPVGSNADTQTADTQQRDAEPRMVELPNGLRCVLRVDKRQPMVWATLAVAAGCRAETEENAGISALLAECLPKGTEKLSAAQIAERAEDMGGALHCQAGNNTILLSLNCLSEDLPAMLELLAEVALRPSFPEPAVQTAREDLLVDIQEEEEDPVALAFRRLRKLCFGSVAYGNPPGGTTDSVEKLTRADLAAMHAALMRGGNAVLSLAGDLNPDEALQLVRRAFEEMESGCYENFSATPAQAPADERKPGPEGKEQVVLALAVPSLPLGHPDAAALLLLDEWCQDMAGPVYSEIREKRGLAYHASSGLLQGVDAGCLYFSMETSAHQVAAAREALDELLARLAEEGMPREALERARATALSARLLASQSTGKTCSAAAVNTVLGLGADHAERILKELAELSHERMQKFIRRCLSKSAVRTYITQLPT